MRPGVGELMAGSSNGSPYPPTGAGPGGRLRVAAPLRDVRRERDRRARTGRACSPASPPPSPATRPSCSPASTSSSRSSRTCPTATPRRRPTRSPRCAPIDRADGTVSTPCTATSPTARPRSRCSPPSGSGVPFGFSVHALDLRKVEPAELRRRAAAAAVVVTCNTDAFAALGAEGVNAHLVPHGVDLDRFAPAAGAERDRHAHVRLLAVGRLVEKKGFPTLLDAMAQLTDSTVTLTIVGDGPDRAGARGADRAAGPRRPRHAARPHHPRRAARALPRRRRRGGPVGRRQPGRPRRPAQRRARGDGVRPPDRRERRRRDRERRHHRGRTACSSPPADAAALAGADPRAGADPQRRAALGAAARRTAEQRFELDRCSRRFCELLAEAFAPVIAGGTRS